MADIQGLDPETGQLVTVPQEAAASAYKAGKLRFKLDEKVPITIQGQPHTIHQSELDEALAQGAELNFDPNGASKALAAGAARSLTMGGSDWLAIEGQKFLNGPEAAESTRQSLQGLREEHSSASVLGEVTGAVGSLFIPGVGEEEILGETPTLASETGALLTADQAAAKTGAGLGQAGDTVQQVARTAATQGATQGSMLGRTFRALANPMQTVGAATARGGSLLAEALGGGRLASAAVSPITKSIVEGSIFGAANAIDESELGDEQLTGEAVLANMESGALWGGAFGLVHAGGARILTNAGRIADRLAEAQLGGRPKELGNAIDRWEKGGLGNYALERGWNPLSSAQGQHEWAAANKIVEGENLGRVVRDAGETGGVSAQEARDALDKAMTGPLDEFGVLGGNAGAMRDKILQKFEADAGLKQIPERPPAPNAAQIEDMIDNELKSRGLQRPKSPSKTAYAKAELEAEKLVPKVGPKEVFEYQNALVREASQLKPGSPEWRAALSRAAPDEARTALAAQRADKVAFHRADARAAIDETYNRASQKFNAIRDAAIEKANLEARTREHTYNFETKAILEANKNKIISFEQARAFRNTLDKLIPWQGVNHMDGITSALSHVKYAARDALEGHIEAALDAAAAKANEPHLSAEYAHAKTRYGMASEIEKMTRHGRNKGAASFGNLGHRGNSIGGHAMAGVVGGLVGHPIAGMIAYGAGKRYGPRLMAWGLHRAAKMASLKAMRQELQIVARRSLRGAIQEGVPVKSFARVAVPDLPPQQMRMTAAEAMAQVANLGKDQAGLRSRLAAMDPHLPVLAPNSFNAAEGAFRRAVTWLSQQIPPHLQKQLQQHGSINPKDLTDADAQNFMDAAAVAKDPRVALDAMSNGTMTAAKSKAFAAIWPAVKADPTAILRRQIAMDREFADYLHPSKKASLSLTYGSSDPGFVLAAQAVASSLSSQNQAKPTGKGMTNASGQALSEKTVKGLGVSIMNTESQSVESGPPGRRGKKTAENPTGM